MKWFKRISGILFLLIVIAIGFNYPKLTLISGYSSKYVASSAFIAGHSKSYIEANDNNIPNIKLATNELDYPMKKASARVFGFQKREAIYKKGLGGKPHFHIISEVLDSEEEVSVEKKSFGKNLSQSISFNHSSLYFFGYVSGILAEKSYFSLKLVPTYLLLQDFRL